MAGDELADEVDVQTHRGHNLDRPFSGAALADLAVDAQYATGSGQYFQSKEGTLSKVRSSAASYDEKPARTLWDDSMRLVDLLRAEEPAQLR